MNNFFGFRVGYIIIAYIVLRASLFDPNVSMVVFYSLLLLYLTPFAFDYHGLAPISSWGKISKNVGFWVTLFTICFALANVLYNAMSKNNDLTEGQQVYLLDYPISINSVWLFCGFWLVLALNDWVVYSSAQEKDRRKELREETRAEAEETFEKRLNYYRGQQGIKK
ncbi:MULTISPECIES: hypothetical protein [unclassified Paenibacillus]|uniref:hypothetical protein n=1 Tax=unclassified Paenibacillus TaxID=185978 RepID=UPI000462FDBE|nr:MULTISPECIES: hypothetical protein [unclassified Paenibacillus]KGP80096.1 hypothetical protein P364_0122105 [Paenibacillus sp. MAEPY2]KGP89403.1 hypothetical protein P363_0100185 [Paenibacillus sp. MAEPY1]